MDFKNNIKKINSKLFNALSERDDFDEDFVMNDGELKEIYMKHIVQFRDASEELHFNNYSSYYMWYEVCEHVRTINKCEKEDINDCLEQNPEKIECLILKYPRQMYMLFGDKFFTDKSVYYKYEDYDNICYALKHKIIKHKQDIYDYIKNNLNMLHALQTLYRHQIYELFGTMFITYIGNSTFDDTIYSNDWGHHIENKEKLTDFSNLKTFTNAKAIYLSKKIIDLKDFSNIKPFELKLSDCTIQNFELISGLTTLCDLSLENCNISDVSPLSSIVNMKWLYLHKNQITDVSPLSTLVKLERLQLSDNFITNIEPLSTLIVLKSLNIENNNITDVSSLSTLVKLNHLNILGNNINTETIKKIPRVKNSFFILNEPNCIEDKYILYYQEFQLDDIFN